MINELAARLLHLRNRHFLLIDVMLFLITPSLALALRVDGLAATRYALSLANVTLVFLIIKLLVFLGFGLYTYFWRYASIDELAKISLAVFIVLILQTSIFFVLLRPVGLAEPGFPRSIPLIDAILTLLLVGGVRYSVRLVDRWQQQQQDLRAATRVIVMGAGEAGVMIVKEMQKSPRLRLYPVAFVDDDPAKLHMRIQGLQVMGSREDIPRLSHETDARMVIIAIPSASGKDVREITSICEKARVETKIIPGMYELLDGTVSVNQLRNVEIEDLLRRETIETDVTAVHTLITGKRVLVTGGGGSIGGELCRQVLRGRPAELVIVGHGENSIFSMQHELARLRPDETIKITPVIADVRFAERIQTIFRKYRPDIVFHAAAHKHVPLMEMNPVEAITNNVQGTQNVLRAALAARVPHFVMISTDKAVNPTSIMGASKRAAELLVHQAAKESGRPYVAVRFGNVLGSRGSVVLTFKQQIAAGGPVTVTHPEMKRFFMTIPEAVQLVLQAATLGNGGEVFVLDMGEPVKIVDLARDLIELSGLEVGRDIDITFTGTRPGEKLFEELFVPGEAYRRTAHEKVFLAANASSFVAADLQENVDALIAAAYRDDVESVVRGLQNLIPEFDPVRFKTTPMTANDMNAIAAESKPLTPDPSFAG